MQPYIFPYVGYFQLIAAVDSFVFYDDVQFIKRGWIHRNRLSNRGTDILFTVPVSGGTQQAMIHEVTCGADGKWLAGFLRQLQHEYARAPHCRAVTDLVAQTFEGAAGQPISEVAIRSVGAVMDYLGLPFQGTRSSTDFPRDGVLRGPARIIDIARRLKGARYVNLPGGATLYDPADFAAQGIELAFIADRSEPYRQTSPGFLPRLSILDVLMHNSPEAARAMIAACEVMPAPAGLPQAPAATAGGLRMTELLTPEVGAVLAANTRPVAVVLGGVSPHAAVLRRVRELGWFAVLFDYKPSPPARPAADLHLQVSTLDTEAVIAMARAVGARAILNTSLDQPLPVVAAARQALGLPSPMSPEAAYRLTNKAAMKEMLRTAGVDTARWIVARNLAELDVSGLRFPVVAKPVGGTGSLGVGIARDPAALAEVAAASFALAGEAGVLVEEFVEGLELSLDSIVIGGTVHFLLGRERHKTWLAGGQEVTCHATVAPAALSPALRQISQEQAEAVARTFGIVDGPILIQAVATPTGRLVVLEVAGRIGGGPGANRVVELATGFDYVGASIDQQLGRPVSFRTRPDPRIFCAHNIYGAAGVFDRMDGMEALLAEGLVLEDHPKMVAGDHLPEGISGRSRTTAFVAAAEGRAALAERLTRIRDRLDMLDAEGRSLLRRDIWLTALDE